ncbi:HIT-like domain-containing protein [Gorgonomyces haynaldii]|nr:HIT-like domain-containing protein [Gorgonomyces haynaldii]
MLSQRVKDIAKQALEGGDLVYTETKLKTINDTVPFQVRLLPHLTKKPASQLQSKQQFNPFLPPQKGLLVHEMEHHNLVLNKYCINMGHLILATKSFVSQYAMITLKDFEACLSVLDALDERYMCFYNCGPQSGASILHKHIQLLPVIDTIPLEQALDQQTPYPFVHAFERIPESGDAQVFKSVYDRLLRSALAQTQLEHTGSLLETISEEPQNFVSYNVVFTKQWLLIVPRKQEAYERISVNIRARS